MLLVDITIDSVVRYASVQGYALTHNYRPRIIAFDAPMLAIPSDHGGFARMQYGKIVFNPLLFSDCSVWPPQISCPITIKYTDTTEAAAETVFIGTAHLDGFNRESISYSLYGPSYDETVASATAYNDTLNVILNTILTGIAEIDAIDTTYARASSPNVTYTTSGIQLAIELASAIAQFYSHLIYVSGTTAYLVDLKLDNGSRTLTEFQFFASPNYWYKPPVSLARCATFIRSSSYPYGQELSVTAYHTTEANINTALDDIIALENAPRLNFGIPMIAGNFPALGEKVTLPDTAHVDDLSSWIRARKLRYDFINDMVNIEGEGAVAAA